MGSEFYGEKLNDMEAIFQSQAHINHFILGCVKPMALRCAVDLAIPMAIHKCGGQPVTIPQLAHDLSLSPTKAQPLAQLMRVLEHSGFFAKEALENGELGYVLTPLSNCLVMDGDSVFPQAALHTSMVTPLLHLSSWFHGDEPTAFHTANGKGMWEFADDNPEFNRLFNDAMAHDSRMVVKQMVGRCGAVLEGVESLVDVGGGNGAVARSLAEAFPRLKCTVYDLPHVVEALVSSERVEYVGGSMFEFVPPADAVLLKWVLHDYDDEKCLRILKQCKEAITSNGKKGKLIVVDMVINVTEGDAFKSLETQLTSDVLMMAILHAKERDEQEFQKFFLQAGFTTYKITPLNNHFSLIEVYP